MVVVSKKISSKKSSVKKSAAKKIVLKKTAKKAKKVEYPKVDWRTYSPMPVIGVDEVGRGCLAGPVYAAAVIFKSEALEDIVTDSKLISEARREEIAEQILKEHQVGIGFATVEEIDELNILQASLLAMKRAVEQLGVQGGHILIDGNMKIPGIVGFEQTTLVKGDLRAAPISAASIVAKVTRDRVMKELGEKYPHYGFEVHKGYSTAVHMQSIVEHGPCIVHRKSFAGVKEYVITEE
ncbi:ribonuclease HII [Bdellovibrio sp. 22V]|uniref:ribonuclease HII n=1 Tax=Bdellovibrio TaxID=958 RepID=UPI002542DBEE|nr:ribonuclease HII [Bdellovibrio sp. 22V]WII71132.1 ribonuclease HII [Bdellovibrio sp. 22V]